MNTPAQLILHERSQARAIGLLTLAFLGLSIWNIWQTHKYRKLEFELKQHEAGK